MEFENFLSRERLINYSSWAGPDPRNIFALYKFNIAISESFYTPLSIFEVTLRNSINKCMKNHYHERWITDNKIIVVESQREMVEKCKKQIIEKKTNSEVKNSQLVSNLNFAFWTSMFVRKNDKIWRKGLYKIFCANSSIDRAFIFEQTREIRLLRNRTSHHLTIIHLDLEMKYKNCLQLIGWMSKDAL